jgi:phage/plasmid-associated DNA primase
MYKNNKKVISKTDCIMLNMNYDLRDLLRQVTDVNANNFTHTSLYGPEAKWAVKNQYMSQFWESYCDLVYKDAVNECTDLCLAELPIADMPLIQDFIFMFPIEECDLEEWDPYDDIFIASMCLTYQKIIKNNYNINDDNQLIVVVLESANYWIDNNKVLMKLRLQFPNTKISVSNQDVFIRNEVLAEFKKEQLMDKMNIKPIGTWDTIMCKNIKTSNILLYGSSQKNLPKIKVIHIWPKLSLEYIEQGMLKNLEVEDVFDFNKHSQVYSGIVDVKIFKTDYCKDYWLPLFLSIHYCSNIQLLKDVEKKSKVSNAIDTEPNNRIFGSKKSKFEHNDEDDDLTDKLINIISPRRFLNESFWLDIGRALHNTNYDTGLKIFTTHTKNAAKNLTILPDFMLNIVKNHNKPNEDIITEACKFTYDTFGSSHISIKTLGFYAREDNEELYNIWHSKWCLDAMESALSGTDTELAEALYKLHWLDFVYDNANRKWYMFRESGWEENSKGFYLRRDISKGFLRKYEQIRLDLTKKQYDSDDENFKASCELTVKKITTVMGLLRSTPKKNKIMTESEDLFGIDRFTTFLDKNAEITGVKNGVLEIINSNIVFRKAKPEDFISKCAGVPFHDYFYFGHPLVEECMTWFRQTFSDKGNDDLVHHFLKFASSGFHGRNSDKIFPILTGCGNNSKSMIIKLFMETFGNYAIKIPVAVLFEKALGSGNASPQLARGKDTRWGFLDEAEDNAPMNKTAIKRLTGGDSFFGRLLHDNGGDITLTFKIVMSANEIPPVHKPDEAIKKRLKIIPFLSVWSDAASEDLNEQYETRVFKMNPSFEKRIPLLAAPFLWILTQYYPSYCKEGLDDPAIVDEYTRDYWEKTDVYGLYAKENLQEVYLSEGVKDMDQTLNLNDLYMDFKIWHRNAYNNECIPNRDLVRLAFNARYGPAGIQGWPGLALIRDRSSLIGAFVPSARV